MANEKNQNGRERYQIDKITYTKDRDTLNAFMCPQGGCGKERKIGHKIRTYRMDASICFQRISHVLLTIRRPT